MVFLLGNGAKVLEQGRFGEFRDSRDARDSFSKDSPRLLRHLDRKFCGFVFVTERRKSPGTRSVW